MNTLGQWLHQHDFLLIVGLALAALAVWLGWRRRWVVWLGLSGAWLLTIGALWFGLRTPAAALLVQPTPTPQPALATAAPTPVLATAVSSDATYTELALDSVSAIEATIANGGRSTLVEVYSDYGIN